MLWFVIRYRYLLVFSLIIAALFIGGYIVTTKERDERSAVSEVEVKKSAVAEIGEFSYVCEKGKSAFAVLESKASVKAADSSFGKLVTAINDREQGDGKYWLYSIDGQEATVGASTYVCNGLENIEWELK